MPCIRLFVTTTAALAVLVVPAVARPAFDSGVRHFKHHPECRTVRCAHNADRMWNANKARERRRREAREAARGWVIPEAIVMCESSGQNLPPNSATASGYYQILDSTWAENGGPPPDEAWRHTKAEQDRVAARIWDGGNGASQWVCKS